MIADLPAYVSVIFILTALLTVGIFIFAILKAGVGSWPAKFLIGFVLFWLVLHWVLAAKGFFQNFTVVPPRVFAFGVLPFFILTFVYLLFFRRNLLANLPLTVLTIIHIIRIPVELSLLLLSQYG